MPSNAHDCSSSLPGNTQQHISDFKDLLQQPRLDQQAAGFAQGPSVSSQLPAPPPVLNAPGGQETIEERQGMCRFLSRGSSE